MISKSSLHVVQVKSNAMRLFAYTSIPLYNSFENKAMFCTQTEYYEILGSFSKSVLESKNHLLSRE